ncbi:hypothetical protein GCM10027451_17710 [Geodermatophilus aquaeductus]|uniref:Uncharacterized protein n=1 Tax=Geodermatophilus aquaeductus TaxID=1564161 RepID=A0A521E330_9ACTN|nr:hypothetical protein [Geodermatophilus aquaeductus]SMO78359.1 hypothetical protein SAMN06273567_104186 [Geodermatophilus aquaeductus]
MTLGRILGIALLPVGGLAVFLGWYLADQRPDQAAGGWVVAGIGVLLVLVTAGMAVTGRPRVPVSPGGRPAAGAAASAAGIGTALAGLPDLGASADGGSGLLDALDLL